MKNLKTAIAAKRREGGFIISAELILIFLILVLALIPGFIEVQESMLNELNDTAEAIGALDQSYTFDGNTSGSGTAITEGSDWADAIDSPAIGGDTTVIDIASPAPVAGEALAP